jgi:hypothetical protein
MKPFPTPLNVHIVPPTKGIPSAPSFVETFNQGFRRKTAILMSSTTRFHAALA